MKVVKILAGVLVLGGLALGAPSASAQAPSDSPKILLHVKAATTKNPCNNGLAGCVNANVVGNLNPTLYHVQVLVAPWDSLTASDSGLAGVQFGLDYVGGVDANGNPALAIDIFGWTLCATLEFATPSPLWPAPGSGNLITWDAVNACQKTAVSTAGYFYLTAYMPATMRIVKRASDNAAKVADCGSLEVALEPEELGRAAFSAGAVTPGCNPCTAPCAIVAVQPSTWSTIKTLNHN